MWKPEHRLAADRRGLRYPSDLTDAEWAIVAPMIPPGGHGGRKELCEVLGVSRGGFYAWLTRPRTQRSRGDKSLVRGFAPASLRAIGPRAPGECGRID